MKFVTLALAMTVGAGAALAADLEPAPVPVEPVIEHHGFHDWSGWYVGGYVGTIFEDYYHDDFRKYRANMGDPDAGVEIYYNHQVENWVLSPYLAVTIPVQSGDVNDVSVNYAGSAGVRAGYAFGRWLPYAFLGGFMANATSDAVIPSITNTHLGVTAGAGLNYAIGDHFVIGARYNYYWTERQRYDGQNTGWYGNSIVATAAFKLH